MKQLVNDEKNKAVYESVEELKCEGGVGYTEPGKVYTYDGMQTPGDLNGVKYVNICNGFGKDSLSKIVKAKATFEDNGEVVEFTVDDMTFGEIEVGVYTCPAIFVTYKGLTLPAVVHLYAPTDGIDALLVIHDRGLYCSYVELAETIVPIDPKFLPKGGVGYAEPGKVILPKQEVAFVDDSCDISIDSYLKAGETYTIVFDGVSYDCIAQEIDVDGTPYVVLGKEYCPVIVMSNEASSYASIALSHAGTHTKGTIEITSAETIHKIDPKFIPGVCLPVVELETAYPEAGNTVELTAEEAAQLDAVTANNSMFIATVITSLGLRMAILFYATKEDGYICAFGYGGSVLEKDPETGTWVMGG